MDGMLDPGLEPGLDEHLAGCEACRKAEACYTEVREHFAGRPRPEAPADLTDRVRSALSRGPGRVVTLVPLLRAAAVAASIVLLASVAASLVQNRPPSPPARAGSYELDASDLLLTKLVEDYAPGARGGERVK
jgi:anti-sigma factor RsiW